MARLLPFSEGKTAYPNRTFSLHEWPFMIHMAGVSSGCIAVEKSDWREAVTALNRAFRESTFLIEVFENDL
jgi:hypothetical protein